MPPAPILRLRSSIDHRIRTDVQVAAQREGAVAHLLGVLMEDCRYDPQSQEQQYSAWMIGWRSQRQALTVLQRHVLSGIEVGGEYAIRAVKVHPHVVILLMGKGVVERRIRTAGTEGIPSAPYGLTDLGRDVIAALRGTLS